MNARTKAGRLLQIAHATYTRGEEELARDIFVLAMEEGDAGEALDAPDQAPSEEELKGQLMQAMEEGDMGKVQEILESMKAMA
jgi:hypothetical protein